VWEVCVLEVSVVCLQQPGWGGTDKVVVQPEFSDGIRPGQAPFPPRVGGSTNIS
jgi:hypothetical protein